MSKLSVVRQIKQQKNSVQEMNKEMEKEIKWDTRFHLGKLPDYNVFKDKNCKILFKIIPRFKYEDAKRSNKNHGNHHKKKNSSCKRKN